jgi:hypothetical protein
MTNLPTVPVPAELLDMPVEDLLERMQFPAARSGRIEHISAPLHRALIAIFDRAIERGKKAEELKALLLSTSQEGQ